MPRLFSPFAWDCMEAAKQRTKLIRPAILLLRAGLVYPKIN
jgi:hypothetical protein